MFALETARLAGFLPLLRFDHRDSVRSIVTVLGADGGQHLVADFLRRPTATAENVLDALDAYPDAPEGILRPASGAALRLGNQQLLARMGCRLAPIRRISDAPAISTIELAPQRYEAIPELSCLEDRHATPQSPLRVTLRPVQLLQLERATFCCGSDAIAVNDIVYVDGLSYPNSAIVSTPDPVVLASSADLAAITVPPASVATGRDSLWLGYPMTEAWGHFLLEGLIRMAVFHRARFPENSAPTTTDVLVSGDVPQSFLSFALYLFPWANFVKLPVGKSITVDDAWVVPSSALIPGRFQWSADGNRFANMDPFTLSLLGERMRASLRENGDDAPLFNSRVLLDRNQSNYRRSASEARTRIIAEDNGFLAIDPGSLSPAHEVNLMVNATEIVAFSGSQMFLSVGARALTRSLFFYHDENTDQRVLSHAVATATMSHPEWTFGSRLDFVPGYSEHSIHQAVDLDDDSFAEIARWMERQSPELP